MTEPDRGGRARPGRLSARALLRLCGSVVVLAAARGAGAQTPTMPSTLRYGSGLLDVPVSSVLDPMTITATFSGFFAKPTPARGLPGGSGGADLHTDGSFAIGLLDRAEVGLSLQALGGPDSGGNVWGLFGRVRLWEPVDQGLGLAVGGRYLTSPGYGDGVELAPGRLGFADPRLLKRPPGSDGSIDTNLTLYGVATAFLRGFDGGPLPPNDLTLTLGYGTGMFREGGDLAFYADGASNGWFLGSSVHFELSEGTQLTLMAEHDGFDLNVGAQVDVAGLRVGAELLGANHRRPSGGYVSEYRRPSLGFVGSIAVCPSQPGFRCRPHMMRRVEPDTVWIPAPPPDTVVVGVVAKAPEGDETRMCLATGQNVPLRVTAAGDTLVAPTWAPIDSLRPTVDFAGSYAMGSYWFESGDPVVFEAATYTRTGDSFPIDCGQILRAGVYQGVPVFAPRDAERPLGLIFIPERPGLWRRYDRSRGE